MVGSSTRLRVGAEKQFTLLAEKQLLDRAAAPGCGSNSNPDFKTKDVSKFTIYSI